jgi:hypothetical protein
VQEAHEAPHTGVARYPSISASLLRLVAAWQNYQVAVCTDKKSKKKKKNNQKKQDC